MQDGRQKRFVLCMLVGAVEEGMWEGTKVYVINIAIGSTGLRHARHRILYVHTSDTRKHTHTHTLTHTHTHGFVQ